MRSSASAYWDSIAEEWARANPQSLWRAYSDAVHSGLVAHRVEGSHYSRLLKTDLFDEAVSAGVFADLALQADSVFGIDISSLMVGVARERCAGLHGVGGDVRCLPFADKAFDMVFSNSTLDHFGSPDKIALSLNELYRVLRPGGELLLTLDNLMNPAVAIRNALPYDLLHRLGIVPYQVGATLRPRRLKELIEHTGFEIQKIDAIMHCPRLLGVIVTRILDKHIDKENQQRFLHLMLAFERLARLPTRFLTGYFGVVWAHKKSIR